MPVKLYAKYYKGNNMKTISSLEKEIMNLKEVLSACESEYKKLKDKNILSLINKTTCPTAIEFWESDYELLNNFEQMLSFYKLECSVNRAVKYFEYYTQIKRAEKNIHDLEFSDKWDRVHKY